MENRTKKALMLGLLLLGCGITSLCASILGKSNNMELIGDRDSSYSAKLYADKKTNSSRQGATMKIYVSGAVQRPGLYDIPMGARADDAVLAAGGMTYEADPQRVNLAQKLKDGMQVNVPLRKNSVKEYYNSTKGAKKQNFQDNYGKTYNRSRQKININTASVKELESLPGVGPSMAKRILAYRQNRSFDKVEDLLKIQGIGRAKLDMLKNLVEV